MKKIALFGTSADPPTVGHQTIMHWLSQHYDLVIVWASDNPFKQHQTPLKDRTAMLRLAIADLKATEDNINFHPELSDYRTLITVNKAREIWGDEAEFSLVIGSDILQQITSWYRSEELLKLVKVLVIPRLGYTIREQDLESLKQVGVKVAIATLNAPKVSSSTYRLQKDRSLIIPAVNNYILQKRLYATTAEATESRQEEKV